MEEHFIDILLADDDKDDCYLFNEALRELKVDAKLTPLHDGEKLMSFLQKTEKLPDVLFLDLNMPRKNGFECLAEIKMNENLLSLPVIIFSTSFDRHIVEQLYEKGAQFYIRKPSEFNKLKKVIHNSLLLISNAEVLKTTPENFVLNS